MNNTLEELWKTVYAEKPAIKRIDGKAYINAIYAYQLESFIRHILMLRPDVTRTNTKHYEIFSYICHVKVMKFKIITSWKTYK